jgi:hypothetical protein
LYYFPKDVDFGVDFNQKLLEFTLGGGGKLSV